KIIGVSNFNHMQLTTLLEKAKIKPMVVQNRCFARTGWDKLVRDICKQHSILYEGFSLLTANPFVLEASEVVKMAKELNKTPEQIVFSFSIQIGMFPLTGTTSKKHLTQDLEAINLKLSQEQLNLVEYIYKTLKS
ncbi:MAG: aldo/keto reductase, partial [Leptospiraceae bacterium]|nr:aldo/keto reductase [Leptospiraceae bacterium]